MEMVCVGWWGETAWQGTVMAVVIDHDSNPMWVGQ